VRTQNAPFLVNRCMNNREYGHLAWHAARTQWEKANAEFPVNPIAQSAKTLEQILERQRINTALRQREGQALAAHLQS
jgi:hypothetical protein